LIAPEVLGIGGLKGSMRESVRAGCTLVTASGDKLLGGPQAGLILGRREFLTHITKHPLARALRVDKFTLAALEATLRLYRDPAVALRDIPTLRYLTRTEAEIRKLAGRLATGLRRVLPAGAFTVSLVPERSQVGGGSLPGEDLPTVCVSVRANNNPPSPDDLAAILRRHVAPVFARIKDDALLFDPRTLEPDEINIIVAAAQSFGNVPTST
jgi:L-seryl-tRNA(Ser) seleniumtransferase